MGAPKIMVNRLLPVESRFHPVRYPLEIFPGRALASAQSGVLARRVRLRIPCPGCIPRRRVQAKADPRSAHGLVCLDGGIRDRHGPAVMAAHYDGLDKRSPAFLRHLRKNLPLATPSMEAVKSTDGFFDVVRSFPGLRFSCRRILSKGCDCPALGIVVDGLRESARSRKCQKHRYGKASQNFHFSSQLALLSTAIIWKANQAEVPGKTPAHNPWMQDEPSFTACIKTSESDSQGERKAAGFDWLSRRKRFLLD